MEGPSRELCQRLAAWDLCAPQEVLRCGRLVRRLARDLPMFDSVWIDALVRARVLTPFQGKVLDSTHPDRLQVGPCILSEAVNEDAWRGIYRGQRLQGGERCLVTIMWPPADDAARAHEQVSALAERLRRVRCETLSPPEEVHREGTRLVVLSRELQGQSLEDLLVRRGRFPAAAVLAIARTLTDALAALEQAGCAHGDVRARNIRLGLRGELRLLHCGLLPAVLPDFAVNPQIPVDVCDGLAPELSFGGGVPDSRSDLYALGCLLWRLLAGRPPYVTGDPQSKIASHQSRVIPDVREYAPETSPELASFIRQATARTATERPPLRELLLKIGEPGPRDRRRLKRFVRGFQGEAPNLTSAPAQRSAAPWATAVVALAGIAFWLSQSGMATELLHIGASNKAVRQKSNVARQVPTSQKNRTPTQSGNESQPPVPQSEATDQSATGKRKLPAPAADGTLWLASGERYQPQPITVAGAVKIRSTGERPALIVVTTPWEIAADSVSLQGVQLLLEPSAIEASQPAIRVRCRRLVMSRCVLGNAASVNSTTRTMVEWTPADANSAEVGVLAFENSVFRNGGVNCLVRPSAVHFVNCLKTGGSPLLGLSNKGRAHRPVRVELQRVSLRESGPLIAWQPGRRAAGLGLAINSSDCVFDVASDSSLLRIDAAEAPTDWERLTAITGAGSVVTPRTPLIGLAKPGSALDASKLNVDGILIADVHFRGADLDSTAACEVTGTDAVRSAAALPGIESSAFPTPEPSPAH